MIQRYVCALFIFLFSVTNSAELIPVPSLKSPVTDLTNTLDAKQRNTLEQLLYTFEKKNGSQVTVLLVPSTKPESIEQYGIRIADQWKLGRKGIADGVILIIAKDDHRIRIEVGRGLEGAIPDVIGKRIVKEIIAPHFLAGDFYTGIDRGINQIFKLIEGEPLPPPTRQQNDTSNDNKFPFLVGLILAIFIGTILMKLMGRLLGASITGLVVGIIVWFIVGTLVAAIIAGIVAFIFSLGLRGSGGYLIGRSMDSLGGHWGGWSGGNGGGFRGGGGDFGGGGASGEW